MAVLDYVAVVEREAARCSTLIRSVDHAAPLPYLPGWTVGDVAAHLAGDFRWVTDIINSRAPIRTGLASVAEVGAELTAAFDRLTGPMLAALRVAAAAPDEPCPNFAEKSSGRLGWWPRHQAMETTLHRWDLDVPTGRHVAFDPALAADGVDELFSVYTERYGPHDLVEQITVRCVDADADVDAGWRITPTGSRGRVRIDRVTGLTGADLQSAPESLLLLLWHRLEPDQAGTRFSRNEAAVRAFLDGPLTA